MRRSRVSITETDVVNFCMLTGNWLELHSNVEYAKKTLYGQRLVQVARGTRQATTRDLTPAFAAAHL